MAKKSAVEKNNRRKRMVAQKGGRRAALRATIRDKSLANGRAFPGCDEIVGRAA
jgi:hypothetical protein